MSAGSRVGGWLLDLLFPRRCPWCDGIIGFGGTVCGCEERLAGLWLPAQPVVRTCPGAERLCGIWAACRYEEPVRGAIHRFKFRSEAELAGPLAGLLRERWDALDMAGRFDALVPVPVSAGTRRRRGYNQSALVAQELAAHCGLPVLREALQKTRNTRPQMSLGRGERLTNLAGCFSARPEQVRGRRVLLVDDVVTTGATLAECAAALLAAGIAEVGAFCVTAASAPE